MQTTLIRSILFVVGLAACSGGSSTERHTVYKNRFGGPSYLESAACDLSQPDTSAGGCRTIASAAPCGVCDVITVDEMSDGDTVNTCFVDGTELCDFGSVGGGSSGDSGTSAACEEYLPPPEHADWTCYRCFDDDGVVLDEGCVPPPIPCPDGACPDGYECYQSTGCLECESDPPPICIAIP